MFRRVLERRCASPRSPSQTRRRCGCQNGKGVDRRLSGCNGLAAFVTISSKAPGRCVLKGCSMTQTLAVAPPQRIYASRRIGHFAVGVFAALCAALVPRLMVMIGQVPSDAGVTVEAMSATYAVAATAFAMLIGGVVVILEWDSKRPPRDIFLAALGVPALLTSMLSANRLNGEVLNKAVELKAVSDQLAREAGIPVEDHVRLATPESLLRFVVPTVFAQELTVAQQSAKSGGLGVRYREPVYWVVLATAATKENAERGRQELTRWGSWNVEQVGAVFYVCAEGGALPYSQAVSKAAEIKRQSQGAVSPKLVRAG